MCVTFIVIALALVKGVVRADDVCKNAREIPYMTERLIGYTLADGEKPICDYFLNTGWYKMEGFTIARSPTPCGTTINWFMNDTLPGKTGTTKDINLHSVYESMTIQVRKCADDNFVFNLTSLKSCSSAYCIESLHGPLPMEKLQPPDVSYISPLIQPEVIDTFNGYKQQHEYYCDFTPRDGRIFYDVEWSLSNGVSRTLRLNRITNVKYENREDFRNKTKLSEDHLVANGIVRIGYTLVCGVSARLKVDGIPGLPSPLRTSPSSFFGFEVEPKGVLSVDRLHPSVNISIKMSFPFRCPINDKKCAIGVLLTIPNSKLDRCEISQLTARGTHCGLNFWPTDNNKSKNITVTVMPADRNNGQLPELPYSIVLETMHSLSHDMIGDVLFNPITVQTVVDNSFLSGKTCTAHSDPHMVSYDGKAFDCQHSGTFVMHRNAKYREEHQYASLIRQNVQFTTDKCTNFQDALPYEPWCVRAVAVRAGRDVFVADLKSNTVQFQYCEDGVLDDNVKRIGSKSFKVYLPTGTVVDLRYWGIVGEYFEIDIHPSVADHNNMEGLCGNFDGNRDNDAITPVRVKPDEDLFNTNNYEGLLSWEKEYYLCDCGKSEGRGQFDIATSVNCKPRQTKRCNSNNGNEKPFEKKNCTVIGRKKRDIHLSTDTDFVEIEEKRPVHNLARKRRSTIIFNETMAKEECSRAMNTTSVRLCSQLHGLDTTPFFDNCVLDATVSRSMEWAQVHIESVKQICLKHLEFHKPIPEDILNEVNEIIDESRNATNTTTAETPITTEIPIIVIDENIVNEIKDASCPNDCSGQGICRKGQCVCNKGFHDEDCSLDENLPPKIIGIPDKGKCDLTKRACEQTSVLGRQFLESPSLSCKLAEFNIHSNKTKTELGVNIKRGKLESFLEVSCPLPKTRKKRSLGIPDGSNIARGYKVSVSNNGALFSAEDKVIIFDSTCVNCSKSRGNIECILKDGFCMANERCYSSGNKYGCYICQGDTPDTVMWVTGEGCIQEKTADVGRLWIIGATVGPVGGLLVLTLVVAYVCSKQKMRARRKLGSADFSQKTCDTS